MTNESSTLTLDEQLTSGNSAPLNGKNNGPLILTIADPVESKNGNGTRPATEIAPGVYVSGTGIPASESSIDFVVNDQPESSHISSSQDEIRKAKHQTHSQLIDDRINWLLDSYNPNSISTDALQNSLSKSKWAKNTESAIDKAKQILTDYMASDKTVAQIADEIGVSKYVVNMVVNKAKESGAFQGIAKRKELRNAMKMDDATKLDLSMDYAYGISPEKLKEKYGVDQNLGAAISSKYFSTEIDRNKLNFWRDYCLAKDDNQTPTFSKYRAIANGMLRTQSKTLREYFENQRKELSAIIFVPFKRATEEVVAPAAIPKQPMTPEQRKLALEFEAAALVTVEDKTKDYEKTFQKLSDAERVGLVIYELARQYDILMAGPDSRLPNNTRYNGIIGTEKARIESWKTLDLDGDLPPEAIRHILKRMEDVPIDMLDMKGIRETGRSKFKNPAEFDRDYGVFLDLMEVQGCITSNLNKLIDHEVGKTDYLRKVDRALANTDVSTRLGIVFDELLRQKSVYEKTGKGMDIDKYKRDFDFNVARFTIPNTNLIIDPSSRFRILKDMEGFNLGDLTKDGIDRYTHGSVEVARALLGQYNPEKLPQYDELLLQMAEKGGSVTSSYQKLTMPETATGRLFRWASDKFYNLFS